MLLGFPSVAAAASAVADVMGSGIVPVALEFMDRPCIHACEAFAHAGYPLDAEALLIVEVEGAEQEQEALLERLVAVCRPHGPTTMRVARTAEESAAIWKGRKGAFGAVGRLSPDYLCMDGTIPPRALPEAMARIADLSERHGLAVANVFHAGDGNLHPLIMYDANDPASVARAEAFGADVLRLCVELGGCLTGEHGVGVEKRDLMPIQFSATDLEQQRRIKTAFDPAWLLNPHKVFPLT
jgi:glycolate oxidase